MHAVIFIPTTHNVTHTDQLSAFRADVAHASQTRFIANN